MRNRRSRVTRPAEQGAHLVTICKVGGVEGKSLLGIRQRRAEVAFAFIPVGKSGIRRNVVRIDGNGLHVGFPRLCCVAQHLVCTAEPVPRVGVAAAFAFACVEGQRITVATPLERHIPEIVGKSGVIGLNPLHLAPRRPRFVNASQFEINQPLHEVTVGGKRRVRYRAVGEGESLHVVLTGQRLLR